MATTFPTYPATTFEQAVELSIFASNQLHNIVNGDATTTVETESGDIPSVRKALVDNFFFKTPVKWTEGQTSTAFNNLYYFYEDATVNGWYYAPSATEDNPISLGSTPVDDDNWVLYTPVSTTVPAQVYPWWVEISEEQTSVSPPYTFDTAIVVYNGVVLTATKDYTITDSVITFTSPLEIEPDAEYPDILFCYLGKIEEGDPETNYLTYENLAKNSGYSLIGTSYGKSLSELFYAQVDTISDLKNLEAEEGNRVSVRGAFSVNDGGAGNWYFDSSDLSSNVTSYPYLFITPTTDETGASGAWRLDIGKNIEAINYGFGILGLDTSAGETFSLQAENAAKVNKDILEQIVSFNGGKRKVILPPTTIYSSYYLFSGVDPKLEGTPGTSTTTGTFFLTHEDLSTEPLIKITSSTDSSSSRVSGLNLRNIACASYKFFSTESYNTFTDARDDRICFSINYVGTHVRIEGLYAGGFSQALYANEVWDGYINNCRFLYCSTPTGTSPAVFIGSNGTDNSNNLQINHLHVEFSPYTLEGGFCEHVTYQSCKFEGYRQANATHNFIKIQAESTKVNFNSCMIVSNNASSTHVVQDAGQFSKWNFCWFSGADDSGYPQAGVHWYRRVSPTNSCAELNGCYFNRCHAADGSDPLDYPIILNNYTIFSGEVRVSSTYNTSSGTVSVVNSGYINVGTSSFVPHLHIIVGSTTKTAGSVIYFSGTGSTVDKITQTSGDTNIYKLVSGNANNTVRQYGNIYQNSTSSIIDTYGRRVIFITASTDVTQFNGLVGEEITIISNVSGSNLIYNSSLLVTSSGSDIAMVTGKPYKFIMVSSSKAVEIGNFQTT